MGGSSTRCAGRCGARSLKPRERGYTSAEMQVGTHRVRLGEVLALGHGRLELVVVVLVVVVNLRLVVRLVFRAVVLGAIFSKDSRREGNRLRRRAFLFYLYIPFPFRSRKRFKDTVRILQGRLL